MKIRKATPQDANRAAILLNHAMAHSDDYIFGNGDNHKALGVLRKLFVAETNRFIFRYTFLAETEGYIAGLLLAFRSNLTKRLDLLTGQRLLKILRPVEILQLLGRVIRQTPINEVVKDSYYISDLAVSPEFRGKKIGTQLLAFAEAQAAKLEVIRCSLIVTLENQAAQHLYLGYGYKIVGFVKRSSNRIKHGEIGYLRMVKELSQ